MLWFSAGGDVQGLMNEGLKVHAIEVDPKQSSAMMAFLRTYTPSYQLGKIVTNKHVRGKAEPVEGEAKVVEKVVEVKCGKCSADTKFPPAQQCPSCAAYFWHPCIPGGDAPKCPTCEEPFLAADVAALVAGAAQVD